MTTVIRTILGRVTICALLITATQQGNALHAHPHSGGFDIGPSNAQVAGVIVGIAAVGAGIGIGIYFAVHHSHSMTGCAASTSDGLQLLHEGDQQRWSLTGDVAGIKPGERIRVRGDKEKKDAIRKFHVTRLAKDFGPCRAQP